MRRPSSGGQLLVAGHVNVDRFLAVRRFPAVDRTEPVEAERVELGGTATNLALVAARAGVRVGLLARVGDGFPPAFRDRLRRAGIDLRGLEQVGGVPTPTCTILETADRRTRTLIQQGPMGESGAADLPGPWWREYRWLHLGTGPPRRSVRLARAAQEAGRRVALDPAQELLYRWDRGTFRAALASADLLFGNRAEIDRATAWVDGDRPEQLLASVPLVVRTEGAAGATAFYRGGRSHRPAVRPARRRTLVGAGDAFRGGFYGGWFGGAALADCLAAGHRAAARWIAGEA